MNFDWGLERGKGDTKEKMGDRWGNDVGRGVGISAGSVIECDWGDGEG